MKDKMKDEGNVRGIFDKIYDFFGKVIKNEHWISKVFELFGGQPVTKRYKKSK